LSDDDDWRIEIGIGGARMFVLDRWTFVAGVVVAVVAVAAVVGCYSENEKNVVNYYYFCAAASCDLVVQYADYCGDHC